MLHRFVKALCFFGVGFFCFSLNASIDQILAADRRYWREGLREAQEELQTAQEPYHRDFLRDHIRGLRALLSVLPLDDRPTVRRLPRPPIRHFAPGDLLHLFMATHYQGPYTYNNAYHGDGFTTPTGGSPTNDVDDVLPNRIALPSVTRNRMYAGDSVSIEQEGEPLLPPDQETNVFIEEGGSTDV